MTYWFSIQYRSAVDDLGISIFIHDIFFFNFEIWREMPYKCQEAVIENTSMEWYKKRFCMIVHETTIYPITDIFKLQQVEGFYT